MTPLADMVGQSVGTPFACNVIAMSSGIIDNLSEMQAMFLFPVGVAQVHAHLVIKRDVDEALAELMGESWKQSRAQCAR